MNTTQINASKQIDAAAKQLSSNELDKSHLAVLESLKNALQGIDAGSKKMEAASYQPPFKLPPVGDPKEAVEVIGGEMGLLWESFSQLTRNPDLANDPTFVNKFMNEVEALMGSFTQLLDANWMPNATKNALKAICLSAYVQLASMKDPKSGDNLFQIAAHARNSSTQAEMSQLLSSLIDNGKPSAYLEQTDKVLKDTTLALFAYAAS